MIGTKNIAVQKNMSPLFSVFSSVFCFQFPNLNIYRPQTKFGARLCFLHLSVSHSVHSGHRSGRYASCWNAYWFHVKNNKDLLFVFFGPFTTKSYHLYLKKVCNSLCANAKYMLVTYCFLRVSCTIWVQLTEMSDSLWRHNAKWKTLMTSLFKHRI